MSVTRWPRFWKLRCRGGEAGRWPRRRPHRGARRRLEAERLEDRTLLATGGLATALPIDLTGSVAENLRTAGEVDSFRLTLPDSGRLTAQVQPAVPGSLGTRLSLLGPDGQLLIQSDGQSATNPDNLITQDLLSGVYFLQVAGLGGGTGAYTVTTDFQPAVVPQQSVGVDYLSNFPFAVTPRFSALADLNGDGHLDLVTANTPSGDVSVLLGLGDGTFQAARNFAAGARPFGVTVGDFNHDGKPDLAVANLGSNDVSILLGRGDGTFAPQMRFPGGHGAAGIATADLRHDGKFDLVIANSATDDISVLLGNGDGTFQPELRFPAGHAPERPLIADFNGDGIPDIAVADLNSNAVSVLLGNGDGTFRPEERIAVGANPVGLVARDFNGDGHLDLAVANSGSNTVSLLLGNGDGRFRDGGQLATGDTPDTVATGDFNHDGRLDLAVANRQSNDVSVLLGRGDGTFEDQKRYRAGIEPFNIVAADMNQDGNPDLVTVNGGSHDVSVLLGLGDGTFQPDLTDPRPEETNPSGLVAHDFNGDGIPDLATTSYTGHELFLYLGRGDGTFQKPVVYPVGSTPDGVVVADFNEDGIPDLATANCNSGDVSILLGRGDGTFRDQLRFLSSNSDEFIVVGDFNGDHHMDLVTGGQFATGGAVLLGNGDGTFQPQKAFAPGLRLGNAAVAGDFNGDGKLDLAATDFLTGNVLIFPGNGDGTFQQPLFFPVGLQPQPGILSPGSSLGLAVGDFNRDGKLDLAVANTASDSVAVLLSNGDGTFQKPVRYATGSAPDSLVAADFNGDGKLDLAVSNSLGTDVSILLGKGDGTFQDQVRFPVGDVPTPRSELVAADLNGDGKLDLAAAEVRGSDISVVLGNGDGSFQQPLRFPVGFGPTAVATGDFNNDGRLDVASVNPTTNELSVSLGRGDTTLEDPVHYRVGLAPVAVATADFNWDGRLDLLTANFGSNDVSVLLGLGDGTFRPEQRYAVGINPVAVVAGDFAGTGIPDLAVANAGSNDVSILLGDGQGRFRQGATLAAGDLPQALVAGDFTGDGLLDLAVANYRSQDLWVYLGRGDGTFRDPLKIPLGDSPTSLIAGDFNGDGILDLATANFRSGDVEVLLGRGDGAFQAPVRYATGTHPASLADGDFTGDGHLDLAVADSASHLVAPTAPGQGQGYANMATAAGGSYDVTLLLGRGNGTFAAPVQQPLDGPPASLAAGDFTGDGRLDLAVAGQFSSNISVLQGLGGSSEALFMPSGMISNALRATPLVADLNGDGLPDVAVVSRQGKILLRLARPGQPGVFDAPMVVNPDPRFAARDLAVVSTRRGPLLAALDAKDPSLSLYAPGPDGTFTRIPGPTLPPADFPVALAAGDLNGDGLSDLVVVEGGCGEVFVYLQNAAGGFGPAPDDELTSGMGPSAVQLVDVDGGGRLDIVVANQYSGDVSVFRNVGGAGFAPESRFRAGTGLFSVGAAAGTLAVRSRLAPAGLVAGKFATGDAVDLVVADSGANSLALLRGDGAGGFFNAEQPPSLATGLHPTAVVAGDFTGDGHLDLAVLNEEGDDLSIYLGDGQGGFTEKVARGPDGRPIRLSAGNVPTGLAVADVNGDGKLDLLVGNDFGDVLTLLGNGDGTFQPYRRAGRNVALAVADLQGTGQPDFVFADEALDRVSVSYGGAPPAVFQDRHDGLLAPSAVRLADLNGDGIPDLVVANGGGNNVLVYPGLPGGGFGPEVNGGKGFPVGTNPVGITVADLTGDGLPDLVVANQGSNDVSVLLGERRPDGSWTLTPGPRLDAHGAGPDSTAVRFVADPRGGPALPQILVANGGSNDVVQVPGVGNGFFDDRAGSVQTFATGLDPRQVLVGRFHDPHVEDLLTVNAGSNDLTFFPNFGPGRDIASGGDRPVAAAAGDLNHDGLTDLVVVNNGDGVVSLLLGEPDGPSLQDALTRPGLEHPTAVDLAPLAEGTPTAYVAEEGQEQATPFVLTFLGIPVPGGPGAGPPSSPAVPNPEFTLLGPGFPGGLNIPSVGLGESGDQGSKGPEAVEPVFAEIVVALVGGPLPAGAPGAEAPEPAAPADVLLAGGAGAAPAADAPPGEEADLPRFLLGLPEALRGAAPGARPDRRAAIDAVFGSLLSPLARDLADGVRPAVTAGLGALRDIAPVGGTVLEPLTSALRAPAPPVREAIDALLQAAVSEVTALGDAARFLLRGASGPVPPARPGAEEVEPPQVPPPGAGNTQPGAGRAGPQRLGGVEASPLVTASYLTAALLATAAGEVRRAAGDATDRAAPSCRGRHTTD